MNKTIRVAAVQFGAGNDVAANLTISRQMTKCAQMVPIFLQAAASFETAVYQPIAEGMAAIEEAADTVAAAANNGVRLIVLPELFCFEGSLVVDVETAVRGTLLKRSLVQKSVIEY